MVVVRSQVAQCLEGGDERIYRERQERVGGGDPCFWSPCHVPGITPSFRKCHCARLNDQEAMAMS